MKTNLIYGMLCLLLAGMAGGCKNAGADSAAAGETAGEGKIRIPSDALDGIKYKAGITATERKRLGIDLITFDEVNKKPNREIARGKKIYTGEEGRLETFAVIIEDHATYVYLASYDADGKWSDCIRIGENLVYAGDEMTGRIEGNTVKTYSRWAEPLAEWGEGVSGVFTITDDLRFVFFAWPPKAFPAEAPFMTHEYDGQVPFCWKIESVVCTGIEGKNCLFTVAGKGAGDCRSAGKEDLTVKFAPVDEQWQPAGDVVSVTLPAVGENEPFEAKIKIPKRKLKEKTFAKFRLTR
ncbi:MAG: hypothetical protein LBP98_07900 [Tannerella sp.]|jgi:hypothetical protein|nr:hypothetical protein [Tannerella sp.]